MRWQRNWAMTRKRAALNSFGSTRPNLFLPGSRLKVSKRAIGLLLDAKVLHWPMWRVRSHWGPPRASILGFVAATLKPSCYSTSKFSMGILKAKQKMGLGCWFTRPSPLSLIIWVRARGPEQSAFVYVRCTLMSWLGVSCSSRGMSLLVITYWEWTGKIRSWLEARTSRNLMMSPKSTK